MTVSRAAGRNRRVEDLSRISQALCASAELFHSFEPGIVSKKSNGDPVTEADHASNELIRKLVVRNGEGWLSEETAEDLSRLHAHRVWVVDPLDGTREFVEGIPEWCISIGLVEDGTAVAGGICNPATGEIYVGSMETGLQHCCPPGVKKRVVPLVLASRSEVKRGEWAYSNGAPFVIQHMGSIAYKMARVAASHADATWTLTPKHEWDVAAGTALVLATGGVVKTLQGQPPTFNQPDPLLSGLIAVARGQVKLLEYAEALGRQLLARASTTAEKSRPGKTT